ncbi:hypothetical protein [Serratia fonticola]
MTSLIEQDHPNINRRISRPLGSNRTGEHSHSLAGIELIHMIRKGQYQHPLPEGLPPAQQFRLWADHITGSGEFANFSTLMRQSPTLTACAFL